MNKVEQYYTLFLGLGEGRSLARLAEVTDKSESYLANLSSKYSWKERLAEDTQVVMEEIKSYYRDRKSEEMLCKFTLAERIHHLIEEHLDTVPITSTADLKRLLEMKNILEGRPNVITQEVAPLPLDLTTLTDEELDALLKVCDLSE